MKPGDIYDDGYWAEFSKKHLGEILRNTLMQRAAQGKPAPKIKVDSNVDRQAHTVDFIVELAD